MLSITIAVLIASNSYADIEDGCIAVEDDVERLKCYDVQNKQISEGQVLQERSKLTQASQVNPFSITPYRTNYLIPLSINSSPNRDAYEQFIEPGTRMDNVEVKFQISFQVDILKDMQKTGTDLYFTYTQLAFWQAYNRSASSPFRETNYEPEIGLKLNSGYQLLGLRDFEFRLGLVHQSNGRMDPVSRSWNRIAGTIIFGRDNYVSVLRPWIRINETDEDDNNPDIEDYLGNFEWYNLFKRGESTYAIMFRNNLQTGHNRGAIQLDMSLAINRRFKLYLQYFNGYGESLSDYNHKNNTFGVGIMLTDWL